MNILYTINCFFISAVLLRVLVSKTSRLLSILTSITLLMASTTVYFTIFAESFYLFLFLLNLTAFSLFSMRKSKLLEEKLNDITKTLNEQDTVIKFISHDLRAPLQSINALNSKIKLDKVGIKFNEQTQKISTNVVLIDELITKFINMAKIKSNPLSLKWINLELYVRTTLYCNNLLEGIDCNITYKIDLTQILVDKFFFGQIIKNLIENAITYRNKTKTLKLEIFLTKSSSNYFELHLRDNGIGIEEKHIKKIFDPFYRVSTDTNAEGLGYGLTIVKFAVLKHRWKIAVNSNVDEGTTFIIRIPKGQVR